MSEPLPGASTEYSPPLTSTAPIAALERIVSLAELKARYVLAVVRSCGGNQTAASKLLGVNTTTVRRQLEQARKLGLGGV